MYSTHGTAFAIDDRHYWRDLGCGVSNNKEAKMECSPWKTR